MEFPEEEEVKEFLEQHANEFGPIQVAPLVVHLKGLGVACLEDLQDIQRSNLMHTGKLVGLPQHYILDCAGSGESGESAHREFRELA